MSRTIRRLMPLLAIAMTAVAVGAAPAGAWAPADTATVHPGVNTDTNGGSCTANFIFRNGSDVLIGQAAHCSSTGGQTDTDGCTSGSLPEGTAVGIDGASKPGTLVYNSWLRMQQRGEADANTCAYNDFALIKVDPADVDKVNPSIPFWGGPTGLTDTTGTGAKVLSYGNSVLRQGITLLSPKEGIALQQTGDGWTHQVETITPGIPGDSGSAFINKEGKAFGVLSTLQLAPIPTANGVSDLSRALTYAKSFGDFSGLELVNGTEPFRGPLVPLP